MSRKYSSWASAPSAGQPDLTMMRLATVKGNEQDQLKHLERVEAIPHMYINVDAPPPPSSTPRTDARAMQPVMISRQDSRYFATPSVIQPSTNVQTKLWPMENPSKNLSVLESGSSTSKRPHRHKHRHHHHHHHHNDKHHHHSRRHRAKSAESIRNLQHQVLLSPSKMMMAHPQCIEQDQQQQPMIVYREVPNGEGYTVDRNGLASVPYGVENETAVFDDQQAPMIVYRDANPQLPIATDGASQQVFYSQDGDTFVQQSDQFGCFPQQQQQSSQIVYCTDPNQQDYFCGSSDHNCIHQSTPAQQQLVCLDNAASTIQPTMINQIPVFNSLSTNTISQPILNASQPQLQRATSFVIQQPQPQPVQVIQQSQPLQVIQQPQQLQYVQQPQPLQVIHQQQPLQVIQQPQPLQIIQNPQAQTGQLVQLAGAGPQIVQAAQPVLQTIQMPMQAVAAAPQLLYQRPYDPVVVPLQNQQVAVAGSPLVALSQPSYAPSRVLPVLPGSQPQGPNMFRHALLRTVADRAGVPVAAATPVVAGPQLIQPTAVGAAPNLVLVPNGMQLSAPTPIVPLTQGGLLIPFQPSQPAGLRPGPFPRLGGYPSNLQNFNAIRQHLAEQRAALDRSLQAQQQQNNIRIPSPPVLSAVTQPVNTPYSAPSFLGAGPRLASTPYSAVNRTTPYTAGSGLGLGRTPFPSLNQTSPYASSIAGGTPLSSTPYTSLPTGGLNYTRPSYAGSILSGASVPYISR